MSERRSKEYDSVDLTEDEDSSEGNSGVNSPFHFVDCSGNLNESISLPQIRSPADLFETAAVSSPTESPKITVAKNIPRILVKPRFGGVQTAPRKKVKQFTSVQIKPPSNSSLDTQDIPEGEAAQPIESVSLDSENESEPLGHLPSPPPLLYNPQLLRRTTEITLPKNDTIYSPKQPPGKVVVIKKNNKFYKIIIPHNVMPNISKSMGPVLINIPEVGPLVISNDPQAAKAKPNELKTQELSLNLDAIDQIDSQRANKMKAETLRDKKFCWTFNSFRKRDLEGFAYSDRLGFNKAEAKKAKKCEKTMCSILTKFRLRLNNSIIEYDRFKLSLLKKDSVRLVKINSIIRASQKIKKNRSNVNGLESSESLGSKVQEAPLPIGVVSLNYDAESDDYGSNLLVTKKVVILNSDNTETAIKLPSREASIKKIAKARRKSRVESRRVGTPKGSRNFELRPCFVQISKDKRVEEAYLKYSKEMGLSVRKKSEKEKFRGRPLKLCGLAENPPKRLVTENHKMCKPKKLFENKNMLLCKTIYSEEQLEMEMNAFKPILIVTDQTIVTNKSLEYYYNEFGKNNIIYVVNSRNKFPGGILKADGFISAVEIGYVKLVEVNLFSKFVLTGMKFGGSEISGHRAEHNYSIVKK